MYCKKCGKEISDDSVFCQKCGASTGIGEVNTDKPVYVRSQSDSQCQNEKISTGLFLILSGFVSSLYTFFLFFLNAITSGKMLALFMTGSFTSNALSTFGSSGMGALSFIGAVGVAGVWAANVYRLKKERKHGSKNMASTVIFESIGSAIVYLCVMFIFPTRISSLAGMNALWYLFMLIGTFLSVIPCFFISKIPYEAPAKDSFFYQIENAANKPNAAASAPKPEQEITNNLLDEDKTNQNYWICSCGCKNPRFADSCKSCGKYK